ncbi:hypothetical protein D3C85_1512090 [compost metagenome]
MERQTTTKIEQVFEPRPITAPSFDTLCNISPGLDRLFDGVLLIEHMLELCITRVTRQLIENTAVGVFRQRGFPPCSLGQFTAFFS